MNYIELVQHQAEAVFGNKAKAEAWLNEPKAAFGGSSAIELTHSEAGYAQVKETLDRIDQGYAG
ncbi:antitoxin Xre/MbcA/ParS toxin-binding domain-containing protein [Pseudomonas sp. NPDC086278]|uniref:antitoxin Xre/MbcA/ParS toxin-binding domain-containing protein n=1 Tax=Pseudomonas sp. NPDC086278 TaxID=3390646 RepID=UPI003D08BAB6